MAVEYIDSPNAGFVKLGEKVGLSTITPERKRKVKRSDRGIFPISPTSAESYEDADFRPDSRFSQPASAIPNVFDRFRNIPGGARADAEIPFQQAILPIDINPNQNPDARQEDADLEEQLRRKSFDIGLDFDPSGRTDPSSPNYDPQAVADRDRQIDENQAMFRAGIGFQDSIKVGIQDALHRASGGTKGQSFTTSLLNATLQNGDPFGLTLIDGDSPFVEGKGKNNNTIGTTTAAGILGIDVSALDTGGKTTGGPGGSFNPFERPGARGSTGGTGFTTNVAKASFNPFDAPSFAPSPISTVGSIDTASGFRSGAEAREALGDTSGMGGPVGPINVPPTLVEQQLDDIGIDFGVPDAPAQGAGEASGLGADFDFGAALGFQPSKDGGKISFMDMKK